MTAAVLVFYGGISVRLTGSLRAAVLVLLLLRLAAHAGAQTRSRMSVYIPMPSGGTAAQRAYFQEAFKTELIGANYPSAETKEASAFSLQLDIQDSPYFDPSLQVDDDNPRYMLGITLERSNDSVELVSFSFPFNDTESMTNWNLFLLYQAMANASMPEDEAEAAAPVIILPPADDWRNKLLYISAGLGLDMGYYLRPGTYITDLGYTLPLAAVGLEWHFHNYLSLEAVLNARFVHNREDYLFTPGAAALLKGVLKPGAVMLEPYGGAEYNLAVPLSTPIPWLSVVGGLQAGVRGGARTAFTLDFRVSNSLLGSMTLPPDDEPYSTLKFSILAGFKIGFRDSNKPPPEPEPAAPSTTP
jgi:hypothetical protein